MCKSGSEMQAELDELKILEMKSIEGVDVGVYERELDGSIGVGKPKKGYRYVKSVEVQQYGEQEYGEVIGGRERYRQGQGIWIVVLMIKIMF